LKDVVGTAADGHVFIGYQAGAKQFFGNDSANTYIGYQAGANTTDETGNVAVGWKAGYSMGSVAGYAVDNTFLGNWAGYNNLQTDNVGIGNSALYETTTGKFNTAVGTDCMVNNVDGDYNSAFGMGALSSTPLDNNTAIGAYSLCFNEGGGNVALGYWAGAYETGSNTFYVGNQDRTDVAGDRAGSLMYGTFNATPTLQTLQINADTSIVGGNLTLPTSGKYVSVLDTNGASKYYANTIAASGNRFTITNSAASYTYAEFGIDFFKLSYYNQFTFLSYGGKIGMLQGSVIAAPVADVEIGGEAARTFGVARNRTDDTAGLGFTILGSGSTVGSTDKDSGDLTITTGISTGTGTGDMIFKTTPAGSSGSSDNASVERMRILGSGYIGIGTTTPLTTLPPISSLGTVSNGIEMRTKTGESINVFSMRRNDDVTGIDITNEGNASGIVYIDSRYDTPAQSFHFRTRTNNAPNIVNALTILGIGNVGIKNTITPTASLHLPAGTATASTAPLKFTS
jgi:hypothetical protein